MIGPLYGRLLSVVGPIALCSVLAATSTASPGSSDSFRKHVAYLASDELQGRGLGGDGIEKAATYIADAMRGAGLQPGGDNGTYFQMFPTALQRSLTDKGALTFSGQSVAPALKRDFIPFNFSSNDEFKGGVVFCGYGIVAADRNYDDFAGIDLKGAVALALLGEPAMWADANEPSSPFGMVRNKIYNAKDRGAVAILLVNPKISDGGSDELTEFDGETSDSYGIPALHITRNLANELLKRGGMKPLDELQAQLDTGKPTSGALGHMEVRGQAGVEQRTAPAKNVIGVLRGDGPLADECVVIGAHYDHLGVRKPMMRKFKDGKLVREVVEPQIHNGADDNASGVAGLIEIARRAASGPRPKRSLVFIAFSAEESGLHGSKHYVDHPVMPLEKTVLMLNMDMIGRMKEGAKRVQVFGASSGDGLAAMLESEAASVGLAVSPTTDTGGRSDHAPFIRKQVPAMHFFSGHHQDYHQPSDDTDKINAEDGAIVAELVGRVALITANREDRVKFQTVALDRNQDATGAGSGSAPTYRVVMGISPGYGDDGQRGMAVEAVRPEGPADLAGIKAGDRVVRINGKDVANINDYMASMRDNKPGDVIEVVVLRDGKETPLKVTLASAK